MGTSHLDRILYQKFDCDAVNMSMMEMFLRQKLRTMSTDEKIDLMQEMMPIVLEEMDPKEMPEVMNALIPIIMNCMKAKMDLETVLPKMAPEMFKSAMTEMSSESVFAMMSRMVPTLLPLTFNKLNVKDRKKAFAIVRNQLDRLESCK